MRFFKKVDDAIESILFRREKKKSIHRIVHQYRSTPYLKCTKGITSKCKEKKKQSTGKINNILCYS